jgi:hypothetical protein
MTIASVLNALAAIPSIVSFIESFAAGVSSWWISRQKSDTLSQISDSIALLSGAKTDADRFNAMAQLQKALSNSRVING